MNHLRVVMVIAKSVLLEGVRRKDIYVIIALCCLLIGVITTLNFFGLSGLVKFYREITLKLMGSATAMAVILLATRQLPREFELRTIYPLLARPVGRLSFLLGKGLGVCVSAAFCYGLFMLLFVVGTQGLGGTMNWGIFLQHVFLQMLHMLILTAVCFLLSLAFHYDAALVIGLLLYFSAGILSSASLMLYALTNAVGRVLLIGMTYGLPQFVLFDLSEKVVHSDIWPPLSAGTMLILSGYALVYTVIFAAAAYGLFRRRPL